MFFSWVSKVFDVSRVSFVRIFGVSRVFINIYQKQQPNQRKAPEKKKKKTVVFSSFFLELFVYYFKPRPSACYKWFSKRPLGLAAGSSFPLHCIHA